MATRISTIRIFMEYLPVSWVLIRCSFRFIWLEYKWLKSFHLKLHKISNRQFGMQDAIISAQLCRTEKHRLQPYERHDEGFIFSQFVFVFFISLHCSHQLLLCANEYICYIYFPIFLTHGRMNKMLSVRFYFSSVCANSVTYCAYTEEDVESRETLWWRQQLQRQYASVRGTKKRHREREEMWACIVCLPHIRWQSARTRTQFVELGGEQSTQRLCMWCRTRIGCVSFLVRYVLKKLCRLLDCCSQINSVVLKRISTVTNGKESRYKQRGNETLYCFLFTSYTSHTCQR